jgi:Arc/MetJ family transcription regulator
MRTNIDLDDELIREAKHYSSARTKRALVEEALRFFVEVKSDKQRREDYAKRSEEIRKITSKLRLGKSAVDIIREDRNRDDR